MKDLTDVKKIRTTLGMYQKQLADALITEIAEQRKLTAQRQLTEKVQQHIDRLLTILEKKRATRASRRSWR